MGVGCIMKKTINVFMEAYDANIMTGVMVVETLRLSVCTVKRARG